VSVLRPFAPPTGLADGIAHPGRNQSDGSTRNQAGHRWGCRSWRWVPSFCSGRVACLYLRAAASWTLAHCNLDCTEHQFATLAIQQFRSWRCNRGTRATWCPGHRATSRLTMTRLHRSPRTITTSRRLRAWDWRLAADHRWFQLSNGLTVRPVSYEGFERYTY
jgi:hypothetical protein